MKKDFSSVAVTEQHPRYEALIARQSPMHWAEGEIRSPFARDYTRILHSTAYRRLKHKTQVFFNIESDHICTRMEHVLHVESVSYTIAKCLNLNEELTRAIATGHDLGHAPFGHQGEEIINDLYQEYLSEPFWHEKNGLYFVDHIELLPNHDSKYQNLNLTYAVRDGIISHCGEKDLNHIMPRTETFDLNLFRTPGQFSPATYEGCVVKMADKIAYVGRDIEDAINLGFLEARHLKELSPIVKLKGGSGVNTSNIMSNMILDVCEHSSVERGICLSEEMFEVLNRIKAFNYEYIYGSKRFEAFHKYARLVLTEIFSFLRDCYRSGDVWNGLEERRSYCPELIDEFRNYLAKYCDVSVLSRSLAEKMQNYQNEKVYGTVADEQTYLHAVLDYLAGMSDRYAIHVFQQLITY